jgi:hypothetical protein
VPLEIRRKVNPFEKPGQLDMDYMKGCAEELGLSGLLKKALEDAGLKD